MVMCNQNLFPRMPDTSRSGSRSDGLPDGAEMFAAAEQALAKIPEKDLVKLVLTGELFRELTPDVDWMETKLKELIIF